jgi:hypothetical protein
MTMLMSMIVLRTTQYSTPVLLASAAGQCCWPVVLPSGGQWCCQVVLPSGAVHFSLANLASPVRGVHTHARTFGMYFKFIIPIIIIQISIIIVINIIIIILIIIIVIIVIVAITIIINIISIVITDVFVTRCQRSWLILRDSGC